MSGPKELPVTRSGCCAGCLRFADRLTLVAPHRYRCDECSVKEPIEALIARSSIGAALEDIKKRGIDAHTEDLAREMRRRRRR